MYYFIVNPGSRSGNGRHVWKEVEEILETEDVEYRVFFTSSRCHATRLAREITARDERITLAAVGGDGTVSEVLSGIQDFSKVTFAYIPTGSSNDFARSLGLPSDTAAAVNHDKFKLIRFVQLIQRRKFTLSADKHDGILPSAIDSLSIVYHKT